MRLSLLAIPLFIVYVAGGFAADGGAAPIAVALSSKAPAFEEALGAFKTALGKDSADIVLLESDNDDLFKGLIGNTRPRIAVAFGSRASEAFVALDPTMPLVVTMVLATDPPGRAKPQQLISTVSLTVKSAAILTKLRMTFPSRKRLAVLLGPNSGSLRYELTTLALRLGYVLEIVECAGPRDALAAFGSLRGRVDFVWCLPDGELFPSAAVAPIILASIRNQLPVIGFSEGFVRAGAAIGFYPDYADIGAQTAEAVKSYLSNQDFPRVAVPRKLRMAVNDRVLRILGIEHAKFGEEVLVIR